MAKHPESVPLLWRMTEALEAVLLNVCGAVFLAMTGVTLLAIFFRYVLGDAISWAEELTRFLLIFVGLFGAALALYRDEHIGFRAIVGRLPAAVAAFLTVLSHLAIMAFSAVMAWHGFRLAVTSGTWAQILPVPMIVPLMIVPLSGCCMFLFLAVKLLNEGRKMR